MKRITRRDATGPAAGLGLGLGLVQTAAAQPAWPTRPVMLLVPLAPGGASDIAARAFGTRLSERRGQPVAVENRPDGSTGCTCPIAATARC